MNNNNKNKSNNNNNTPHHPAATPCQPCYRHATPCHAGNTPRQTTPHQHHAAPRCATSCYAGATPHRIMPTVLPIVLPCHATLCHATLHHATLRHITIHHATPVPHHSTPFHATLALLQTSCANNFANLFCQLVWPTKFNNVQPFTCYLVIILGSELNQTTRKMKNSKNLSRPDQALLLSTH
jgi:hypothetical protein